MRAGRRNRPANLPSTGRRRRRPRRASEHAAHAGRAEKPPCHSALRQPRRCKEERLDNTKPGGFPPGFVFVVWSLSRLRAAALQRSARPASASAAVEGSERSSTPFLPSRAGRCGIRGRAPAREEEGARARAGCASRSRRRSAGRAPGSDARASRSSGRARG